MLTYTSLEYNWGKIISDSDSQSLTLNQPTFKFPAQGIMEGLEIFELILISPSWTTGGKN